MRTLIETLAIFPGAPFAAGLVVALGVWLERRDERAADERIRP